MFKKLKPTLSNMQESAEDSSALNAEGMQTKASQIGFRITAPRLFSTVTFISADGYIAFSLQHCVPPSQECWISIRSTSNSLAGNASARLAAKGLFITLSSDVIPSISRPNFLWNIRSIGIC